MRKEVVELEIRVVNVEYLENQTSERTSVSFRRALKVKEIIMGC